MESEAPGSETSLESAVAAPPLHCHWTRGLTASEDCLVVEASEEEHLVSLTDGQSEAEPVHQPQSADGAGRASLTLDTHWQSFMEPGSRLLLTS